MVSRKVLYVLHRSCSRLNSQAYRNERHGFRQSNTTKLHTKNSCRLSAHVRTLSNGLTSSVLLTIVQVPAIRLFHRNTIAV